jgi:hypothetical protein
VKVVQEPSIARNTIFLRPQRKPTSERNIYLNGMQKKRKESLSEIMNLMPEVNKYSQHKYSLFIIRDTERKTFNIAIVEKDKVSKIKIKYYNISAPNQVQFHKNTSDLLYSDYLNLNMKNEKLTSFTAKIEYHLR